MALIRQHVAVVCLAVFTTGLAEAQVADKPGLTLDGAKQVIAAAVAEAKRVNAPGGVIAVVDDGGNLMALERIDGTFAAGANISIGKARTAVDLINKGRTAMTAEGGAASAQHALDGMTLDQRLEGGRNSAPAYTIGIGLSPGDATYAEPYWYVTPWPYPDEPLLSALDGGGEWHRTGWLGAVLTGSKIAAEPSAEGQARLVNAFLGSAVDACRALLST